MRRRQSLGKLAALLLGVAGVVALPAMARADAIDGEWCREGRHFVIEGPSIVTYGGTRMTGDYDRHGFRYTVPATEPESGVEIVMQLHSETTLELFRRQPGATQERAPGEIWNRCRVTS